MNKKNFDVSNQVVILTGGLGLLGSAYTRAFASQGAIVHVLDIIPYDSAQRILRSKLKQAELKNVYYHKTDIANKGELLRARGIILKRFRKIDVLINNAAITAKAENLGKNNNAFEHFDLARWNREIEVNLTGTMLCCQVFGPAMKGGGAIINISSTYGVVGPDQRIYPKGVVKPISYSVTKGAMISLTKYLATYWGAKQIRVNCVVPGGVLEKQDRRFVKQYAARTPLGRMAQPDEYVGLLIYLASKSSSYCTGGVFTQDGGWTAW